MAKWIAGGVGTLIVVFVLAYAFVPVVRYYTIPVFGSVKAPEKLGNGAEREEARRFVPGTLANRDHVVDSIHEVPAEGGWINTAPLDLKQLEAEKRVILIDFWTYTCINCIRATPYTQELWDRYKDHGLVVIGVHSPEFGIEHEPKNVFAAVKRAHITYPVLLDADMKVWKQFGNHAWPGKYLIDPAGEIVYTRFGEGDYDEEEKVVRKQLTAAGWKLPDYGPTSHFLQPSHKSTTPELYAGPGFARARYGNVQQPEIGKTATYTLPPRIEPDRIYLGGTWSGAHDYVQSVSEGRIVLTYIANVVYIVLDRDQEPVPVEVRLDDEPVPERLRGQDITERDGKTEMRVDAPRLYYPIAATAPYGWHTITFATPPGLRFYSFTFGAY